MKETVANWLLVLVSLGVLWLLFEKSKPDVIETTKRIQDCENIVEELNGQINQSNQQNKLRIALIKRQKNRIDTLNFFAIRAITVDSLAANKAKEWGWTITKQEREKK